jgi:hypothetical protein
VSLVVPHRKTEELKMEIIIHDLNFNPPRIYKPRNADDCKGAADRSAYELAVLLKDTVTAGKVIVEYKRA